MSSDYHDYVIVDGRLVGAWDEMYDACVDPWWQSQQATSDGRDAIVRYAHEIGARSLVEIGCGLGYFTAVLAEEGFAVAGVDVSAAGVERARRLHPELADRFHVGRAERDLAAFAGADAVVFSEVTWYVLDHLDDVLEALRRDFAGKHLIHLLTFYAPGTQRYGRDFFTTPDELADRFGLERVAETRSEPDEVGDYTSTILFGIPA